MYVAAMVAITAITITAMKSRLSARTPGENTRPADRTPTNANAHSVTVTPMANAGMFTVRCEEVVEEAMAGIVPGKTLQHNMNISKLMISSTV
ncbi:hypothetical protein I551_0820 [Mycobacterium ulcerans str. Harvey]|nr:hypothetical protein I551_0820 [Mycobacterium ulcerans str. Harvey]